MHLIGFSLPCQQGAEEDCWAPVQFLLSACQQHTYLPSPGCSTLALTIIMPISPPSFLIYTSIILKARGGATLGYLSDSILPKQHLWWPVSSAVMFPGTEMLSMTAMMLQLDNMKSYTVKVDNLVFFLSAGSWVRLSSSSLHRKRSQVCQTDALCLQNLHMMLSHHHHITESLDSMFSVLLNFIWKGLYNQSLFPFGEKLNLETLSFDLGHLGIGGTVLKFSMLL